MGRSGRLASLLALAGALALAGPRPALAAEEEADSCVDCHRDPDFLVTNKKLRDYYVNWELSIHSQEGVTCSDCHGGNPALGDKESAHGGELGEGSLGSAVNFRNIPRTCGQCHEEIYKAYRESHHSEHLIREGEDRQGPNCVTCHGSINVSVLNVTSIRDSCTRCHNDETENHPDIPDRAHEILNDFLSIHRFYRYITVREMPEDAREFFEMVDDRIDSLSIAWHTFDLDEIEEKTGVVLYVLKAKRKEIGSRTSRPAAP